MTEPTKPAIYAAIVAAMGKVKRLAKDSRNAEQKYDFASIDDFLAMTGPIMAECGLFIHMDEGEIEAFERQGKYGATFWLRVTFIMTVYHASGESLPPVRRTVEVIRTGAQSFGSAQSYALKQFQRALFNIPTGDKDDADFAERGEGAPVHQPRQELAKPAPRRADPAPEQTGPTQAAIAQAILYLDDAEDRADLTVRWKNLPAEIKAVAEVKAKSQARAAAIDGAKPALPDDEIKF